MKYSYLSVAAMLSSLSLTSHRHKSSLPIRRTMATNCFPPHGSVKNNANGWKDLSLGSTRLCSCGMQMGEAWSGLNLVLNPVQASWKSSSAVVRNPRHAAGICAYFLRRIYYWCWPAVHASGQTCTQKAPAWYKIVWLRGARKQQQLEAARMTGESFFNMSKMCSHVLFFNSRDLSGAKSPCLLF